ncbi:MAG: helix-turn-helix domain-containing protein [Erysipelotrichaceae bacterium]|jgi:transposase|nr:helix-turn-helix domain-containing protein [Erysipelotrichaceae bacterium]MCB9499716.1 helix-turn-helix domain-containing protein [Erysipelotrichaceae bacterium]
MNKTTYLESFKINLVKKYLNGENKAKICKEFNVSKSTMWGWICKYGDMVRKTRQLEEKVTATEEFIDITRPLKKAATEEKIIYASNSTIRIFKNGYSILCDIDRLKEVLEVIQND